MTFDKAIEELKILSENGADTWYGDNLEKRTHVRGHIESGSVEMLIYKLRKEYAPTIEMTKEQYKAFVESVEGLATQKQLDSFVDEELDLGDMTVRRGLNAWLHPETIKVIGEDDDKATSSRNED